MTKLPESPITLGWREWVELPTLGIARIKAKIDTGARTSALHAFEIEPYSEGDVQWVRFLMHPVQRNLETVAECRAPVIDQRVVTDSGGHKEKRWVISSLLKLRQWEWPVEFTLTSRDNMLFRMLLGRTAMQGRVLVDPAKSYLLGKRSSITAPVPKATQ